MLSRSRFKMRRLGGLGRALVLSAVLAGCQLGGKAEAPSDIAPPTALQGPAIEVTALPSLGAAENPPAAAEATADTAPQDPKPAAAAEPEAAPEPMAAPVIIKSAGQIACEKRGGNFVSAGKSGAMTCQTPTRDGGKQCRRESDCEGVCLARSFSCAPAKPLLGCNEILQDDGYRVELCID